MNPISIQIIVGIAMIVVGAIVQLWLIRWAKRDSKPEELSAEIDLLRKDVVTLRGQVKYIQGILNGKHWKQGET